MTRRLFATTLAFALTLTASFAGAQEKTATTGQGPRLTIVEPVKDFGTVPKGEKLDWAFEIRNTGTADLQILAAKPTCGCTVADFDKVIKPGQSGKVHANVDTTGFAGPISKGVTIESNDASTPTAQVTISAIVKPYVDADKGYVRYNMLQGETGKETITIYSEETEPFQILKVTSPKDWIKVDYRKAEGADILGNLGRRGQAQYKIDVTVGGDEARIGPIAEKIHIVTNSKHQPDYWVSVSGVIRPTFRVEPTQVNFGEVAVDEAAATRTILFRSNDLKTPENFVVSKAESGVAGVTAAIAPTERKGEYTLTLQVDKDAKGSLDGSILVHTNDKITPVVTIPVKGSVKGATAASASK
jgi:hypothetical protein